MTRNFEQDNLRIPGELLSAAGLRQRDGILLTLSQGMALLTNSSGDTAARTAVAAGLRRAARTLSIPLEPDGPGLYLPAEMLEDAGLCPEEELEFTVEDGRILIEQPPDFEEELLEEAWDGAEDDAVLGRAPDEVRRLLRSLGVHPASARDAILEGGYAF